MDPKMWHKVAAISGIAALGLGTYGSHVFKPENLAYKQVWQTASLYHLVHTAALVAAPITKHPNIFGGLLTTGILAFSGSFLGLSVAMETVFNGMQQLPGNLRQLQPKKSSDQNPQRLGGGRWFGSATIFLGIVSLLGEP